MHATSLRSDTFEITVGDHPGTISEVFPGFDARDRLGIVIDTDHAAAGAGTLILAAVTAFYDCLRAGGEPFFAYPDYFAFHVGVARGSLRKLDVYPGHKEVVVPADPEQILQAINDRAVTRLLVPDGEPIEPALAPETRHGARRRIQTALAYSPTGRTARPDILVRGSAQSDSYIDAMLGSPGATPAQARPAQGFRRVSVDEALGLLVSARG